MATRRIYFVPGYEHLVFSCLSPEVPYEVISNYGNEIRCYSIEGYKIIMKVTEGSLKRDFKVGKKINSNPSLSQFLIKTYGYIKNIEPGKNGLVMEYFQGDLYHYNEWSFKELNPLITRIIYQLSTNGFVHYDIYTNILFRAKDTTYIFNGEEFKSNYEIKIIDFSRSYIKGIKTQMADCPFSLISPGLYNPIADFMYYLWSISSYTSPEEMNKIDQKMEDNDYTFVQKASRNEFGGFPSIDYGYDFEPDLFKFGHLALIEDDLNETEMKMTEYDLKFLLRFKFCEYFIEKSKLYNIKERKLNSMRKKYSQLGNHRFINFEEFCCVTMDDMGVKIDNESLEKLIKSSSPGIFHLMTSINLKRIHNQKSNIDELFQLCMSLEIKSKKPKLEIV